MIAKVRNPFKGLKDKVKEISHKVTKGQGDKKLGK